MTPLDDLIAAAREAPRRIVANLPYNVATALLVRWLTALANAPGCLSTMVLMFQKEVAERLAAPAGNRTYGRLSVLTQWLCRVRPLFDVPARAFTPPPKVVSTVVGLEPLPAPAQEARLADLERVTAAAFGQRRKMLRQSLKSLGGEPRDLLDAAGIDETVLPHAFYALAGAASLIFAVAPECRRLTGLDPETHEAVETHADFVARLLVP